MVVCGLIIIAESLPGLLLRFDSKRSLDKFIDLEMEAAFCVHCTDNALICGGGQGIIRIFSPKTLDYLGTMPLCHPVHMQMTLGEADVDGEGSRPHVCQVHYLSDPARIVVLYSDHSIYHWLLNAIEDALPSQMQLVHG